MKSNAILRIILWSIVIIVLLGIMLSVLGTVSPSGFNRNRVSTPVQTEVPMNLLSNEESVRFSPDTVREIEIEWAAGSILLQSADVEEITVSESDVEDERYAMLYQQRDGKLSISFCREDILSFDFGITINESLHKDLTIFVPRDWEFDNLEIDAASATVEGNDLTIREVDFDGASGVCVLNNCKVDTMDIDTASGDVRYSGSLNILDFDSASANVSAVLTNTPTRIDIDSMSGDLDLTLPEDTGFTVSMDAMASSFSSDYETTLENGTHIHGDGRCRIHVDAMSGDVYIRRSAAAANGSITDFSHHEHDDSCYTKDSRCPDRHHG